MFATGSGSRLKRFGGTAYYYSTVSASRSLLEEDARQTTCRP